jgi:hypothetical protein
LGPSSKEGKKVLNAAKRKLRELFHELMELPHAGDIPVAAMTANGQTPATLSIQVRLNNAPVGCNLIR